MAAERVDGQPQIFMVHAGESRGFGDLSSDHIAQMQGAVETLRTQDVTNPRILASATMRALQSARIIREGLGGNASEISRSSLLHVAGQTPDGIADLERLLAACAHQGGEVWPGQTSLVVIADGGLAQAVKHNGRVNGSQPLPVPVGDVMPIDLVAMKWQPKLRQDFRTAHLTSAVDRALRGEDLYSGI